MSERFVFLIKWMQYMNGTLFGDLSLSAGIKLPLHKRSINLLFNIHDTLYRKTFI